MRMLSKTHKKCQMESSFFSMLCQYVVFPLTLSLPLDKTRYSASSPYFGILHCTALVYNPFASFKIHGKPPLDIFLLLLLALQKHSLSLVSNVKWTFHSLMSHYSLTLMSFQTSMTDLLSFMDHRRWYFDFIMFFLSNNTYNVQGLSGSKTTTTVKLYNLCHTHVHLDLFYSALVSFLKQGTWYLLYFICRKRAVLTYFKIQ